MIFRRFCQSPTFERFEHAGLHRKPVKGTWAQQKDACHVFSHLWTLIGLIYSAFLRCVPPRFMRSYNDLLFLAENVESLMSKGKSFDAALNIRVKLVECVDICIELGITACHWQPADDDCYCISRVCFCVPSHLAS